MPFFSSLHKVTFILDGVVLGEPGHQLLCPENSLLACCLPHPRAWGISTVTCNREWGKGSAKMVRVSKRREGTGSCPPFSPPRGVLWPWLLLGLHFSGETSPPIWPLLCGKHEINLGHRKIIRSFCTAHLELVAIVRSFLGAPAASTWGHWGFWEVRATPDQRACEWLNGCHTSCWERWARFLRPLADFLENRLDDSAHCATAPIWPVIESAV